MDPKLHKVLKLKALHMKSSISELITEALRLSLKEDVIDLKAIKTRLKEPARPFESVLNKMKKDGLI
jgi:hypothetical protein